MQAIHKKNIGFLDCDNNLIEKVKSLDAYFEEFIELDMEKIKNKTERVMDIVIINQSSIPMHEVVKFKNEYLSEVGFIFYHLDEEIPSMSKTLLENADIMILEHSLNITRITSKILTVVFEAQKKDNVFIFYGADRKVGTTMISQTIAKVLSEQQLKVCYVDCSGVVNQGYLYGDNHELKDNPHIIGGFENIKVNILNGLLTPGELIDSMVKVDDLSVFPGISGFLSIRHYSVDMIRELVNQLKSIFDIVIIDAGSPSDYALHIGALTCAKNRFLVATEQTSVLNTFNTFKHEVLNNLELSKFVLILNKITAEVSSLQELIKNNYNVGILLSSLPNLEQGSVAESNEKTLFSITSNKKYKEQIYQIANFILEYIGKEDSQVQIKKKGLFGGRG